MIDTLYTEPYRRDRTIKAKYKVTYKLFTKDIKDEHLNRKERKKGK